MKNFILILSLFVFTVFGCSDDNSGIESSKFENYLNLSNTTEIPLKIDLSAYPRSGFDLINCFLTDNTEDLVLTKEMDFSGLLIHSGESYGATGDIRIHSCSLESSGNQVSEKFSGIILINNHDSIFVSGTIIINLDNNEVSGELNIGNGSGKYSNCRGSVRLFGSADLTNGHEYLEGEGSIIFYNSY